MCSNADILPTSLPCAAPSSESYYYHDEGFSPPAYTPISIPLDGNENGASSIWAPVVFVVALSAFITVAWAFFTITGCMLWIGSRPRTFFDNTAFQIRETDERLHAIGVTAITNQAETVALGLGVSGLEEKLTRLLPIFYYHRCTSDTEAPGQLSMKLLQSIGDREDDKQEKLMHSSCCRGAHYSENECAVCLSHFQEQEKVRILPACGHLFHMSCIDMWLQSHKNCPLCRQDITLPAIHHFLRSLKFYCAEDHDTNDMAAANRGAHVRPGIDTPVDGHHATRRIGLSEYVPSPSRQSYNQPYTPSVLESSLQEQLSAAPLCSIRTANRRMPFGIDGCHVVHVCGERSLTF